MTNGMHTMQLISLDAIMMLIIGMEIRCKGCKELCKPSRHEASLNLPTREDLLAIKANKRVNIRSSLISDATTITEFLFVISSGWFSAQKSSTRIRGKVS